MNNMKSDYEKKKKNEESKIECLSEKRTRVYYCSDTISEMRTERIWNGIR
jgi:hypothetical protein